MFHGVRYRPFRGAPECEPVSSSAILSVVIVLDCESAASTLESLSSIYGLPAEVIEDFLRGFDLDSHYNRHDPCDSADHEVRAVFEAELECAPTEIDRVCWFHLTRTRPGTDFAAGILPLTIALDVAWATIIEVFSGTIHEQRLRGCHANGVQSFQYRLKTADPLHAGPYAMLVKEVAFRTDQLPNHDYLRLPEILEDICHGYESQYGDQISEILISALTPTIVKFWSAKKPATWCVGPALLYLYCKLRNRRLSIDANTCFDGENQVIPASQIVRIEQVRDV